MHESAFLSLILVQIKVKFQGECIFFFSQSPSLPLSLSPGRGFKGKNFNLLKKKIKKKRRKKEKKSHKGRYMLIQM